MSTLASRPGEGAEASPVRAIADRIAARREALAREMVERYREDIVEYRLADDDFVFGDVYAVSLDNVEALLDSLAEGRPVDDARFDRTRRAAARRLHRGISLEAFLHAARLWGQLTWQAVLDAARVDDPAEREAALEIAGAVLRHVDAMSAAVAASYLAEAEDVFSEREVVRRDLLDVLISGKGDCERIRRLARSLGLRLASDYIVVVLQADAPDDDPAQRTAERPPLRAVVHAAREQLRPGEGSLLLGMRQGEVVALYPASHPGETDAVRRECDALAVAVGPHVSVGMSGWHAGLGAIEVGYAEARDAVQIAVGTGTRGRAVAFDDVLIDHMIRSSPHGDRILDGTLRPLLRYDEERQAELVRTLRAYVEAGFNLTKSADVLCVHPNTVVYRLRRIRELSGRDPHDPDDLLLLFLGLKVSDLSADH